MVPRRGGYGSVGINGVGSGTSRLESTHDFTTCFDGDRQSATRDESTLPFPPATRAGRAGPAGGWSWWRVCIATAVAVTGLSVAVSVVRFAKGNSSSNQQTPFSDAAASPPAATAKLEEVSAGYKTAGAGHSGNSNTLHDAGAGNTPRYLSFVAENDYTRRGDVVGVGYSWLEGKVLVEPYRTTSLEVVSPVQDMAYKWKVYEEHQDSGRVLLGEYTGSTVEVVFKKAAQYTVVLLEYRDYSNGDADEDGIVVSRRVEYDVLCKYVRRELRSLFPEDRNEMFDAMKVLWDVKTAEGKKIYGETYMDVWDIDKFHQVGASDIECDHLHDGIGFGITHSMVTMMFEASMQLVNPRVSLAYWDWTIEGVKIDTEHDGDFTKVREVTDMWTPEWFGGVDVEDWQVKDGRWAFTEVPILPEEERDMMGADVYGRMRSPWNVNDKPYLVRGLGEMCGVASTTFYKWPTCSTHYDMQDLFTSYYGYTWYSQYQPHGPMHVWVGGNVDCEENMDTVMSIIGEEYRDTISGFSFIMRKDLFRSYVWKCHGAADTEMSAKDVMLSEQCGCPDYDLENGDDYLEIYQMFADKNSFETEGLTDSDKRKLAIQYCSGVIGIGESSESSSPLDPTFWSLHPTMERLLSFKLLTSGFADYSWPDEPGLWTGMDGVEYDVVISVQSDECYGHRGSDVFPYGLMSEIGLTPTFTINGMTGPNTYTNRELIHFFDPSVHAFNYIYDNFDWDHCEAVGVNFKDFYDTKTGKPGRATTEATEDTSATTGKKKVHGFGIFKAGDDHRPLYFNSPVRE